MDRPPPSELPPARPPSPKPTSVRDLPGATPSVAPDLGQAVLEVEGTSWTVRVLGRVGRASGGSATLLLLGFWEGDAAGRQTPSREALVVGRALEDLPSGALEESLATAQPPRDPEKAPGFFQESAQGGRRRRANENI
jgi:hypothetical protein